MKRYIAFLRGINVGGKNKLSMPELKSAFERHGFSAVITYINSGNLLFSSDVEDAAQLKTECEALIAKGFGLDISVTIVPAYDLARALEHAPPWWNGDKESKHNAIFAIPPVTVAEVFAHVGESKPEYEQVAYFGNVIFWSAPIQTFSRTRWSKIVGSAVYGSITIRNANTVGKLAALAQIEDSQ